MPGNGQVERMNRTLKDATVRRYWLAPIEWSWRNVSEAWPRMAALRLLDRGEAAASGAPA